MQRRPKALPWHSPVFTGGRQWKMLHTKAKNQAPALYTTLIWGAQAVPQGCEPVGEITSKETTYHLCLSVAICSDSDRGKIFLWRIPGEKLYLRRKQFLHHPFRQLSETLKNGNDIILKDNGITWNHQLCQRKLKGTKLAFKKKWADKRGGMWVKLHLTCRSGWFPVL